MNSYSDRWNPLFFNYIPNTDRIVTPELEAFMKRTGEGCIFPLVAYNGADVLIVGVWDRDNHSGAFDLLEIALPYRDKTFLNVFLAVSDRALVDTIKKAYQQTAKSDLALCAKFVWYEGGDETTQYDIRLWAEKWENIA